MKIIFLDCDGVLNSNKFFQEDGPLSQGGIHSLQFGASQLDPKGLALIDKLVNATGAKIVISSSWRHIFTLEEIISMFENRGFKSAASVIDRTGNSINDNRGDEVDEYLGLDREREIVGGESTSSYVIIDDNDEFTSAQHEHFIHTNPETGITPADVARAIHILNMA